VRVGKEGRGEKEKHSQSKTFFLNTSFLGPEGRGEKKEKRGGWGVGRKRGEGKGRNDQTVRGCHLSHFIAEIPLNHVRKREKEKKLPKRKKERAEGKKERVSQRHGHHYYFYIFYRD